MQTTLSTFQPRLWLLVLQFLVLFAPSHLYPVEDQESETVYRINSGIGQNRPHMDGRNRYERPTQLSYDPTLDILMNQVEHSRHRSRNDVHGSPEIVPDLESGFPPICTGLKCLKTGDGVVTGEGNVFRFSHGSRGKRTDLSNVGTGTLDKLGGANLIRKRFYQTGSSNRQRRNLGAVWRFGPQRHNGEPGLDKGLDSMEIDFSKRGLFGGFFTTPRPSFESRVGEHPFGADSKAGLFKDYNSVLHVGPPTPSEPSSTGLFNLFNWGSNTRKRDSHLDRLGGANLVKRFDRGNGFYRSLGVDPLEVETSVQSPSVVSGESNLNLVKERFRGKGNFDPDVLFEVMKGTVVGQAGDSVDFGFIRGEPYSESSKVDARTDQSGSLEGSSVEGNDYLEYVEGSNLQRRGHLDSLGGSNLQKRKFLDSLGGQNLQKKRFLDRLGGQNLQRREYLDTLGGQNLQKKLYLDSIGGQNLQKRYLGSLGGQNLQKRNYLDSLGGQNLQKRDFLEFLKKPNLSDDGISNFFSNITQGQGSSHNAVDEIIYVSHSGKRNSENGTSVPESISTVAKVEVIEEPGRLGEAKELFKVNFSESNEPTKFVEGSSSQNLDPLGGTNLIRNLNALEHSKGLNRGF